MASAGRALVHIGPSLKAPVTGARKDATDSRRYNASPAEPTVRNADAYACFADGLAGVSVRE